MEIDTSNFALHVVLSQMKTNHKLHLVVFYSKKFLATKINYEIYDKKLLTIVDSFQEWHHYAEGTSNPINIYIYGSQEPQIFHVNLYFESLLCLLKHVFFKIQVQYD